MNFQIIMLSEVSQTEKDKYWYNSTYMRYLEWASFLRKTESESLQGAK